ncbi:MAG: 3-deoxy-manno-octulosonate cytidylyltransferase [Ignavibacterium sp.]|jgi:3-deoxy-manno-octulosonate cytidylyltransferase (CMP-KDO synthetase)|nr:MAG: 3-deoxy-manno-octulosonate cytidylyltransferase [Ignavibacterium sp.]MDD5609398.1 3-deoxy-manno-octulosonate cytidylyltransferase [Ignavibacterium sp.]MDX9712724.1 3-deoxy-manno-octulosonate cytidylyltransferase [Ignavibacteriaceae bacterium]MEB2355834.1 3-deoxy-manno-octulosonate cytidylyltransferase [Ignavibacteriales bacterium]GIK21946.1 MAG: 3-deoxy-manno-octulosonate cytidylyltransferase [Ignavibacteriota bacterium]
MAKKGKPKKISPFVLGIIPARFASTRLMGKPLADIGGKSLLQHTFEGASKSKLVNKIVIAVDDEQVAKTARKFGAPVIMTPKDCPTGSDRIAIAAKEFPRADIVVNIQGDEPFISGMMIDQAIEPLIFDPNVNVSTLVTLIDNVEELESPSVVKVVFDYKNFALYFSRSPIPFVRDANNPKEMLETADIYKHIGLYVYRKEYLFKFTQLEPTDLEQLEKLEQLRMLENGFKIKIVETEFDSFSVDTPEDLEKARKIYSKLKKIELAK